MALNFFPILPITIRTLKSPNSKGETTKKSPSKSSVGSQLNRCNWFFMWKFWSEAQTLHSKPSFPLMSRWTKLYAEIVPFCARSRRCDQTEHQGKLSDWKQAVQTHFPPFNSCLHSHFLRRRTVVTFLSSSSIFIFWMPISLSFKASEKLFCQPYTC